VSIVATPECSPCLNCLAEVTLRSVCALRATDGPARFTIAECPACGVLRTLPVPDELAPFYATDLARTMHTAGNAMHERLRRLLLRREARRVTASNERGAFLDVGCGDGSFALLLHQSGHTVIAADAAAEPPPMIAGTISYRTVDFEHGEIAGLAAGCYTVVLRHVLEHVRHPRRFLARLVEHGATRFYIVLPNSASLERRLLGTWWYLWDPPRHLWHFDASSLRTLLATLGLEVVARGYDTIPNLVPSVYRLLRVRGWSSFLYQPFGPRSMLTGLSAPLNLLVPHNVLWMVARARASRPR